MGCARFETVLDYFKRDVDVAVRCEGCRHLRHMTREQFEAVFGIECRLIVAARRLRCSRCGHKGARLAAIPRLE